MSRCQNRPQGPWTLCRSRLELPLIPYQLAGRDCTGSRVILGLRGVGGPERSKRVPGVVLIKDEGGALLDAINSAGSARADTARAEASSGKRTSHWCASASLVVFEGAVREDSLMMFVH